MAAGRSWERNLVNSAESTLEITLENTGGSISIEPFAFWQRLLGSFWGRLLSGKRDFRMLIKAAVFGWG